MVLSKLLARGDLSISHIDNTPRLVLVEVTDEETMGEDSRLQGLSLILVRKIKVANFSILQRDIW